MASPHRVSVWRRAVLQSAFIIAGSAIAVAAGCGSEGDVSSLEADGAKAGDGSSGGSDDGSSNSSSSGGGSTSGGGDGAASDGAPSSDGAGADGAPSDGGASDGAPSSDGAGADGAGGDAGCGTCTGGQSCVGGTCACPVYQDYCAGKCIPVSNDPNNCGACGFNCPAAEACVAGKCRANCPPGFTNCGQRCVDVKTDSQSCGSCVAGPCPAGTGCSDGTCVATVVPFDGGAPPQCVGGGPPIVVGAGATDCLGKLAAVTFAWSLCSCLNVNVSNPLVTDAYDSTKGPYAPGGLGGGVGANGSFSAANPVDVGGTLWTSAAGGLATTNPTTVRQALHVGGPLQCSNPFSVGRSAHVVGNINASNPLTIAQTLYHAPGATRSGVTYGALVDTLPVSVPLPCGECTPSKLIDVSGIVAAHQSPNNDNASIGLNASVFATPGNGPRRLDLPCGKYYLTKIDTSAPLVIAAHGRTALFIGGDVAASSPISFILDSTAEFDVFISGTMRISNPLKIGSQLYPALSRTYVGGTALLELTNPADIGGNVYAAHGPVRFTNPLEVFGAVVAGDFTATNPVTIHYDTAVLAAGGACPSGGGGGGDAGASDAGGSDAGGSDAGGSDAGGSDAGDGGSGCGSCKDCSNQACINGKCDQCTSSSQCCPPLVCVGGTCKVSP